MTNPTTPSRGAGRPRSFDRDQALRVAMRLFWAHGYEGTSTAQLIGAIGISQTSLYAAFGSKESLFREAVALYQTEVAAPFKAALFQPGRVREAVAAALVAMAHQYQTEGQPKGCMVATEGVHCTEDMTPLKDWLTQLRKDAQEALTMRLKTAIAQGELPKGTPAKTWAAYFAAVIQGMSVQAHDGATLKELTKLAELAMAVWPQEA